MSVYEKLSPFLRRPPIARTGSCLTLACAIVLAVPTAAQDVPEDTPLNVPGDGFLDTMAPAAPGAQEVIVDVPNPFFWSRYQTGQIGDWTYTLFPDGSGHVSKGTRDAAERVTLTCVEAVACEVTSNDGTTFSVPATGAPAPAPPQNETGETVSRYLAAWVLAGTGTPPAAPPEPPRPQRDSSPSDTLPPPPSTAAPPPVLVSGPPVPEEQITDATQDVAEAEIAAIESPADNTLGLPDTQEPRDAPQSAPDIPPEENPPEDDGGILDLSVPNDIPPPRPVSVSAPAPAAPLTLRPQTPAPAPPSAPETVSQDPPPNLSFAERTNLRCSFTTSTSLSYERSNGSDGLGKLRANLGCSGNITENLSLRFSLVEYANHAQQQDFDPDFTYAFTYRINDKINIGYSNYGGRYDEGLLDALGNGTLRANITLPKLTLPNGRAIACTSGLGLPNPIDSRVSLSCGYSVTDKLRIGATANLYFPGAQGEFDPDYSYTASYRISDDWQLSYSNYSNNRFPWNRGDSPGPGLSGGSLSLSYRFDF